MIEVSGYKDIPHLDPINQFENIHPHQYLRTHHQHVPKRDPTSRITVIQHRFSERDVDERIDSHH